MGLKRRGYDNDTINLIQDVYRILYTKGYSTRNALDIIEKEIPDHKCKDAITSFIRNSERGIMRGYSGGDDEQ